MDLADVVTIADSAAPVAAFLPFLLPALIGLGGTLIGGAMKNSAAAAQADKQYANDMATARMQRQWNIEDRDEARAYSRKVYSQLVEDAEAAGFNPLTALRNGGGASYNAAAGFAPLSRTAPTRQAPYQGGIGDAVSAWSADFMANFDPFQDDKREMEYRLVEAQIANLNASTRAIGSQSFNVPVRTAGTRERRPSGQAAQLSASGGVVAGLPEIQDTQVTNPAPFGSGWERAPWNVDAQNWEDAYGEPGDWVGGAFNFVGDSFWNFGRAVRAGASYVIDKFKSDGGRAFRAPPDLYDNKMYIPPQMYRR